MTTAKERIQTALVIDEPWIDYILRGEKTWEMRASATHKRGRIGLIRKGSGTIVGEATLIDSPSPLDRTQMLATIDKHRIPAEMIVGGSVEKWRYPWVLADVQSYPCPVSYEHPSGAVIWVRLDESETPISSVSDEQDTKGNHSSISGDATCRSVEADSAAIVRMAEELASKWLRRTGDPTKYIAGFVNKSGQQLAIERNKQTLFVWVESFPQGISGVSIRNSKNPGQPYAANQSRNSNLRSRAPRLAEGHVAYYLSVDDLESFERLIRWYAQ